MGALSRPRLPGLRRALLAVGLLALLGWAGLVADRHLRAAALLLRLSEPADEASQLIAGYRRFNVGVEERRYGDAGSRGRVYSPRGRVSPPAIVLVHGMHPDGIDEARLIELARAFAATGVATYTPAIDGLTRYSIDAASVRDIAEGAQHFAQELGVRAVGVIGVSFAGGLALLAAEEPSAGEAIAFVVAIGAHDDLSRVARWYGGEPARGPSGETVSVAPHPYGAGVFIYGAAAEFFPPADLEAAREALGLVLAGQRRAARARLPGLSAPSRHLIEQAIDFKGADPALVRRYLEVVEARHAQLAAASPAGKIGGLSVPVYLLHGVDDPIVPSTETAHLAAELQPASLERVLVTPALRHAERAPDEELGETFRLVEFMAEILEAADDERN